MSHAVMVKARFVSMLLADTGRVIENCHKEGCDFRMVRYMPEQRIFLVETYLLKKKSYERCVRKFRQRYPKAYETIKESALWNCLTSGEKQVLS
jgi:hypothetical protein